VTRTNQKVLLTDCALAATNFAFAQDQSVSELAMAAQNPIASLIRVPIQSNINFEWGSEGDTFSVTNIQPVHGNTSETTVRDRAAGRRATAAAQNEGVDDRRGC
jgi:hypothetical protein